MDLRSIVNGFITKLKTGKKNLEDWGQVVSNPTIRQDYNKYVVQPTIQKMSAPVIRIANNTSTQIPRITQAVYNYHQSQQTKPTLTSFGPLVIPNFKNPQVNEIYKPVTEPFVKYGNQAKLAAQTAASVPLQKVGINYAPDQELIKKVQDAGMLSKEGKIGKKEAWNTAKNTANVALKVYGASNPALLAKSALGGAAILPVIKIGTNIYNKKKPLEGVPQSISEGYVMGLANAGTTRLTNNIVQGLSKYIPALKPLTEGELSKNLPTSADALKEGIKKWVNIAGKKLIKAAVLETAVETPIWATLTQTEQENYSDALQREAVQNLIMNVGMAGVSSLRDTKVMGPAVKKAIDDSFQKILFNSDGALKARSGKVVLPFGPENPVDTKTTPEVGIKIGPKSSLQSEKVSTPEVGGIEALKQEAKNYKSAEEFVNKNDPVKYERTHIFRAEKGPEYGYEEYGPKMLALNLSANDLVKGKGITREYTLNALKDAYENGASQIQPSLGAWTKDGKGFMDTLVRDGWVRKSPNGTYFTTEKIKSWETKSTLTDIWNKSQSPIKTVSPEVGGSVFSNKTGMENYDNLLAGNPSGADVGKKAEIVMMSPDEYLAQIKKANPTKSSIDFMKAKIAKGEQLPMASLDFSNGGKLTAQEGRNRAYLAKELGITEMPVLKVTDATATGGVVISGITKPKFQKGVTQVGLTSAQGSNPDPVLAKLLDDGNKLYESGKIDEGMATLQKITETTKPELEQRLADPSFSETNIQTNTHGLYFGNPEPSYWIQTRINNEGNALAEIATFAKGQAQESFITATKSTAPDAKPGIKINLGRELSNQEVVSVEKILNDNGLGVTLNQKTGEIVAFNVPQFDSMDGAQFIAAARNATNALESNGFDNKYTLAKFDTKVYTNSEYDNLISRRANLTSQPGSPIQGEIVGGTVGKQNTNNLPQEKPGQEVNQFGIKIKSNTLIEPKVQGENLDTAVQRYKDLINYATNNNLPGNNPVWNEINILKSQIESAGKNNVVPVKPNQELPSGEVKNTQTLPTGEIAPVTVNTANQARIVIRNAKKLGQPVPQIIIREKGLKEGTKPITIPQEGETVSIRNVNEYKYIKKINPDAKVIYEIEPNKGDPIPLGASMPSPEEVAATIPAKVDSFIQRVLGYSVKNPETKTRNPTLLQIPGQVVENTVRVAWTRPLLKAQEAITTKVEQGLASNNGLLRTASSFLQDFFAGLGMSPERAKASRELKGGLSVANQRAYDVMDTLYKSLAGEKDSLARINAVLDPEISTLKISVDDLTPKELATYKILKEGFSLIHDMSYANGSITKETYLKNKWSYTPRAYDTYEMPDEVNQFVTEGMKKLNNDMYKKRGEITDWSKEHSINDPIYLLGKRMSQLESNMTIRKYMDFLASNPNYTSAVEKKGYIKLSDSKAYGPLSGKYVLNSAAEDLKGHFFENEMLQQVYDVFRAYDKLPIRQLQKKFLTVLNPTTNVGNITTDNVFGFLVGVDPLTLNKNILSLKQNPALYKQYSDYLMRNNIIGTDITRTDFTNKLGSIDSLTEGQGKKVGTLTKIGDTAQKFYGGTDDVYKAAAFKALIDQGKSLEEATRLVKDGFQNYSSVGKFYDFWAKTPVIGQAFIKFQGDLIRIIKNGVVNRPLQTMAFLATLKLVGDLSSKLSGETPEDKKVRENRAFAPVVPGLNIPLTYQTAWGELNVARYISPLYANNAESGFDNFASKTLPFGTAIDLATNSLKKKPEDLLTLAAKSINDPLLSPLIQVGLNRDFRGKPISDQNETKYKASTLTPGERLKNQGKFLFRNYMPPLPNTLINIAEAGAGQPDQYGNTRTLPQSILRAAGIKIQQFGPKEVQNELANQQKYAISGAQYIQQNIKAIQKDLYDGKITPEEAQARIDYQNKQMPEIGGLKAFDETNIPYRAENGDFKTLNIKEIISMPASTNYEKALKQKEIFTAIPIIMNNPAKTVGEGNDAQQFGITEEQRKSLLAQLGVSEPVAKYYTIASTNVDARTGLVLDKIGGVQDQSKLIYLFLDGMIPVNGKKIITSDVITNLVNRGVISKDYAKYINSFVYNPATNTFTRKAGSSGSGVSGVKKPSYSKPSLTIGSSPKVSGSSGGIKISIPKLKTPNLNFK